MPDKSNYQKLFDPVEGPVTFYNGWHAMTDESLLAVPEPWRPWLFSRGSLTTRLMDFSNGDFRVRVLQEIWRKATRYEALKLKLSEEQTVRMRDVELLCHDQVMVFARTIIPLELHQREKTVFNTMGTRPLGHFLFREGEIIIANRDIKHFEHDNGEAFFARATPYKFRDSEILVREFFINPDLITGQD